LDGPVDEPGLYDVVWFGPEEKSSMGRLLSGRKKVSDELYYKKDPTQQENGNLCQNGV